ncbi:MAG: DUF371 domain-containing protein [Promethearchaeota archaeon]
MVRRMGRRWSFQARGHENILANHKSTVEVTKEKYLTPSGDCIIGIGSSAACADIPRPLAQNIKAGGRVRVTLECGGLRDSFVGVGAGTLTLSDPTSMVFRKSTYACPRTALVRCDKSATDLSRELVAHLKDPEAILNVVMEVLDE